MEDPGRHLARGFRWLGGATIIARVTDAGTMLALLLFLTKQQVGVAALVLSVGTIVESLDGLGTAEALMQGRPVSRTALDTLFWFILASSAAVALLTLLAAPALADAYGVPGMALFLVPIALKQPLVGAAVIPLARLNRTLQYERIASINVAASLLAAALRLALAVGGAGVWAPVAGYVASGVFVLAGAAWASPFVPRARFRWRSITPLLRFGLRVTTSNLLEQTFKSVDFLLVGAFYGPARLAVYRVAFDLAMEPAMAIGTLLNRTALPVFARLSASGRPVAPALAWSLRRVALLAAPLTGGLILAAGPLTALLHDGQGRSYGAAALPLGLLAAASLLRIVAQLLYPLMMGSGQPGTAARLSALTMLLLTVGILAAGWLAPAPSGIVAVSAVWLFVYPIVLLWGLVVIERRWRISARALAGLLVAPASVLVVMVGAAALLRALVGPASPALELGLAVAAAAGAWAVLRSREGVSAPLPLDPVGTLAPNP